MLFWNLYNLLRSFAHYKLPCSHEVMFTSVMLSPRGQSGLESKILASASASKIWPRPGLDLVVFYVNGHFSGKKRVKFGNFVNFPAIILNSMLLIIIWYFFHNYFWPRPWPQPPEIGLGLVAMASASVSQLWPRPRGFGHV